MKKTLSVFIFVMYFCPGLILAAPGTIEGTIQGYNCVMQGRTCPVGSEDPLVATENTFILLTGDNKYYFIPNVDRAILARHVAEKVKIYGDIDRNNALRAQVIWTSKDGKWKEVWDASSPFNPRP